MTALRPVDRAARPEMTGIDLGLAQVLYMPCALTPQRRELRAVRPQAIHQLAPQGWRVPFVALLDGEAVLRADWHRPVMPGQTLAFVDVRVIPQGGGGGGSNPMRMIAMLAVMTFAPTLAQNLIFGDGIMAAAALGNTGLAAFNAAAVFAGMAVVGAVFPPPKPPTTQQAAALAAPSPTYALQAQGNSARLEAAIPEHFGRHMAYLDYAAQPYQEFAGNEQYLYQLFCQGRGEYDIEQIRIEDTPIASFDEITYEVVPPGGSTSLFPANVVTSAEVSGQELTCSAGTYSQSGTTLTVTLTGHGLSVGRDVYLNFTSGTATDDTYTVASAPTSDTFTVTMAASASTSGNVEVSPWVGGFNASASDTSANYLGADFVMPRGLYQVNTGTGALNTVSLSAEVQARPIDASGTPTGAWVTLGLPSYTASTTTPQRNSERWGVGGGRYQVRARRTDVKQTDTNYGHDLVWGGLRAYLPETRTYGDVTLIAMRMRASNNLSMQASRKVNTIATRRLPVWNGSTWSAPTGTRSIAWAMAYAAKQIGKTDAQIDLAGLLALDAVWAARGDYFDARFDNFLSFWEAVTKIAQAGRAKPFVQGGVLRVVRDAAATIPVCVFSQRNIVRNSLTVNYLLPTDDTADSVDVSYFDSGKWATSRVRCTMTGSTALRPKKVDLFGVTGREHAFREGIKIAADNRYRRKIIKFRTEMEGFIPSFLDLIHIQHDMPGWGQGGEAVAWDAGTLTLTVSEQLDWSAAGSKYVGLRKRDGSMDGPYLVTQGATAADIVFASAPAITPYTGQTEERTHILFGAGNAWRQPARLLGAKAVSATQVEITAVNEDDNVHTAETGLTVPTASTSSLANYTNAPVVLGLMARSVPGSPEKMLLSWEPSPWAEYYIVEQSAGDDRWTRSGEPRAANFTAIALYGNATVLRVAAVGVAKGPWVQIAYGDSADYMWNSTDTTLMWNATDTTLMWRY